MILILKSKTSGEIEEVTWSEDVVDFLYRYGAILEIGSKEDVFIVDGARAVRYELYLANLI